MVATNPSTALAGMIPLSSPATAAIEIWMMRINCIGRRRETLPRSALRPTDRS